MKPFAWYVVHRQTKYIVAGFADADDAHRFADSFKHKEYIVLSFPEIQ